MMINDDPDLLTDKDIMMIRKGYTGLLQAVQ